MSYKLGATMGLRLAFSVSPAIEISTQLSFSKIISSDITSIFYHRFAIACKYNLGKVLLPLKSFHYTSATIFGHFRYGAKKLSVSYYAILKMRPDAVTLIASISHRILSNMALSLDLSTTQSRIVRSAVQEEHQIFTAKRSIAIGLALIYYL
jgi:hypothetical protein